MSIVASVTSQAPEQIRADLLAVPMFSNGGAGSRLGFGPGADVVDVALGGRLQAFAEEVGFAAKAGETLAVSVDGRLAAKAVLLVGLGAREDLTLVGLRRAAAAVARRASKVSTLATTLAMVAPDGATPEDAAQAVAEGVALGAYQYLAYKSKGSPTKVRRLVMIGVGGTAVTAALTRARVVTDAVCWARDMVNAPSGAKSPAEFSAAARRLLTGKGVTVTVLSEAQLRAQKMGGVLGVGQGSAQGPRFVKVVYEPAGSKTRGTLALVGKGVVFDSGGLSLKPASGMETMKQDMSGAAAVLAAMSTLQALGVKSRVVAYAPMVENMPSGTAIRPGDVLRMRNGSTVEVLNTDAEGRLILADGLSWAADDGADAIVDVATLTGACIVALGDKTAGVMGNDDEWVGRVRGTADRVGESVWPLPLPEMYKKLLDSTVADLRNISSGGPGAGTLTAGLFLQAFVGDVSWAHLDIAGPAWTTAEDGEVGKGGTGFSVRTLIELARTFEKPTRATSQQSTRNGSKTAVKKTAAKKASKKVPAQQVARKAPAKKR